MKRILIIFISLILIACGEDKKEVDPPISCFDYSPENISYGDTIYFQNCSENATSYIWDFGDGTSVLDENPSYKYREFGSYTVTLGVENEFGSDTFSRNLIVNIGCELDMENYDVTFGIDYESPNTYLLPGEQSDLNDSYIEQIRNVIGTPENSLDGAMSICHYVNQYFSYEDAGGAMIGELTANDLFQQKKFYGCHSQALIIGAILRKFGFPVVMVETACVQWAYEYAAGTTYMFAGHVMNEVFVEDKWMLFDNNCTYVENYDCKNPFMNMKDLNYHFYLKGVYVIGKGYDTWDYGEGYDDFTHTKMVEFSDNILCFADYFYTTNYYWQRN
jgi:PKD domain/Transglutaminase-like superfamily